MARTTKKKEAVTETATVVTRAEKKGATKNLIRELLAVKPHKHNELIDAVANLYAERFGGEETDNINDVKGRVGSVLDIMKKESEVTYDGGMYALKARAVVGAPAQETEEKPVKTTRKTAKKAAEETGKVVKKTTRKSKAEKKEDKQSEETTSKANEVNEIVPEVKTELEKPAPKKRGRKPKAKAEEAAIEPVPEVAEKPVEKKENVATEPSVLPVIEEVKEKTAESKTEVKEEEKEASKQLVVKEKAEVAKKNVVMDMSFLFGEPKTKAQPPIRETKAEAQVPQEPAKTISDAPARAEEKTAVKTEGKSAVKEEKTEAKAEKSETKPTLKTERPIVKAANTRRLAKGGLRVEKKPISMTAEERLKEAYLKRIRSLGGDYFEYYSVYLLERYSMKNGRRLEGMKISGGDHDGGIDGEIELTDKLGFRETIYIQSKNWNPEKGNEKLWVVGETLLQQFIGACACRQAKDGKQHCRGIFITTSRFTPEAKRILDSMSDKIVGYDGDDLFEAAKECSFGLIEKNGAWVLDERLLSGTKAFFNLY